MSEWWKEDGWQSTNSNQYGFTYSKKEKNRRLARQMEERLRALKGLDFKNLEDYNVNLYEIPTHVKQGNWPEWGPITEGWKQRIGSPMENLQTESAPAEGEKNMHDGTMNEATHGGNPLGGLNSKFGGGLGTTGPGGYILPTEQFTANTGIASFNPSGAGGLGGAAGIGSTLASFAGGPAGIALQVAGGLYEGYTQYQQDQRSSQAYADIAKGAHKLAGTWQETAQEYGDTMSDFQPGGKNYNNMVAQATDALTTQSNLMKRDYHSSGVKSSKILQALDAQISDKVGEAMPGIDLAATAAAKEYAGLRDSAQSVYDQLYAQGVQATAQSNLYQKDPWEYLGSIFS